MWAACVGLHRLCACMFKRTSVFIRAHASHQRDGEGAHIPHVWGAEVVSALAGSRGDGGVHVTVFVPAHRPR